jgi:hypothetical protein
MFFGGPVNYLEYHAAAELNPLENRQFLANVTMPFEKSSPGRARVQAICDFVRRHIAFGYKHARDDDVLGGLP